ncbi:phosphotransferase, partial [candidate division KSB1 bacterium]|nr:phosphotransferase [candidate division KSB1 bacterium]
LADLFTKHFGVKPDGIAPLAGDGSDRKLFRLSADKNTAIGVLGHNPAENRAFVYFSRFFKSHHLPVPDIYCSDLNRGVYLLQDLGETTLYDDCQRQGFSPHIRNLYHHAIERLVQFQISAGCCFDSDYCYQTKAFDREAMLYDLNNFYQRFLKYESPPALLLKKLQQDYVKLTEYLCGERMSYFLYRDFQSRNIMVLQDRLYFIDYQSGRRGALQYDVASFLYDSNLVVPDDLKQQLLLFYIQEANKLLNDRPVAPQHFIEYYYGFALLRIMQAIGAFSFLWRIKGKSFFKENIPRGLFHISKIMQNQTILDRLPTLRSVFNYLLERWGSQ